MWPVLGERGGWGGLRQQPVDLQHQLWPEKTNREVSEGHCPPGLLQITFNNVFSTKMWATELQVHREQGTNEKTQHVHRDTKTGRSLGSVQTRPAPGFRLLRARGGVGRSPAAPHPRQQSRCSAPCPLSVPTPTQWHYSILQRKVVSTCREEQKQSENKKIICAFI